MDLLTRHARRSLASAAMCVHGPVPAPGREQQADLMERGDRELEDPLGRDPDRGGRMTSATVAAAARGRDDDFCAETPVIICSILAS